MRTVFTCPSELNHHRASAIRTLKDPLTPHSTTSVGQSVGLERESGLKAVENSAAHHTHGTSFVQMACWSG